MGPTASGKSALALEVARRLPGPAVELVSVDAMQVYRGMDVGTAKPTAPVRAEVPHHLLDMAGPDEEFSLSRYATAAGEVLRGIEERGHRALLVGGTGLYLQAVVDGLRLPGRWPAVRAELEGEPDTAALYHRLAGLDPLAASRMVPANRRRVVRALEVTLGSGRPFSSFGPGLGTYRPTSFLLAGVWLPRAVVGERIRRRLASMVEQGLVDEVDALRRTGMARTARQALGYREVLAHLEEGAPLDRCVEEAVRRTRAFARRQRMWFRRDPRISWHGATRNPVAVLPSLLGEWSRCA